MNKKTITIAILAIFLTATLLPSTVYAAKSKTTLEAIPATIDKPMGPEDEKNIEIKVGYQLDMNKILFRILKFFRIGRVLLYGAAKYYLKWLTNKKLPGVTTTLSVTNPDWCTVTLEESNFSFGISTDLSSSTTMLKITDIQPDAPALESDYIIISAYSDKIGIIQASGAEINISIMASYSPEIILETEMEQYNISPINETVIPIEVKNEGNGESTISVEFEEVPENWNVTLDKEEITLDVDEEDIFLLYVTPVKTFVNDTVKLKFTPMSTTEEDVDEEDLLGEPVYLDIELKNDGSLKEDEEELPLLEIAVIIIIIAILVIIIYFFFFWRRE